jgi:glycosyltransferase involved in cell wall biosynthesis
MEVMAHAKPVVAFDVGGVREWLVNGVTGLLVPREDISGLGAAIQELLTNPERRAHLGGMARQYISERFGQENNFNRLIANYRELLN